MQNSDQKVQIRPNRKDNSTAMLAVSEKTVECQFY